MPLGGRGGYDPPLVHPKAGTAARGILAGVGLGSGSGGPPHVPSGRPLWGWHPPPLRSSPGGRAPLPGVRHQRGYHAVALDNGPQRPCGCGDAGAAGGGPHMAPPAPYSFLPPVPYRDQCQLSPTALGDWLRDRAAIPARAGYEARWGVNYMSAGGLPLDWFDHDQQRRITAHPWKSWPLCVSALGPHWNSCCTAPHRLGAVERGTPALPV